jgi:hypothetical protein
VEADEMGKMKFKISISTLAVDDTIQLSEFGLILR